MKLLKRLIYDQKGDGYLDLAVVILIIFLLLASLLGLFPVLTAQQSLQNTARQIAREVEITGQAGPELDLYISQLPSIAADEMIIETVWADPSKKTIQLKTPFTVILRKSIPLTVLKPSFTEPLVIRIQITAQAHGISEVYHK
jgi:Flp pilus assembly protein TadG